MTVQRVFVLAIASLGLLLAGGPATHAVSWSDDFNDGSITDNNPVTWLTNVGGFFPGSYDASSGDLILTPPVNDGTDGSQMSGFVPTPFTDTYVRTQGIIMPDPNNPENTGGNLVLLARTDLQSLSGFLMYFDVSGNLNIQQLFQGATFDIGTTFDAPFNAGEEVIIEFHAVGTTLSGYAWAANDPMGRPDEPQVTADTLGDFPSGLAGIAFAEDDDGTFGIFRYVEARDTPFPDEPVGIAGDFDGDMDIDGNDFLIWQQGLTAAGGGTAASGDANGDGNVDGADFTIWAQGYGTGSGGVSAVPEPASLGLGLVAACFLAAARTRGRRV
jgi:hypothetical protein